MSFLLFARLFKRVIHRKVPEITPLFWVIKLLTTAMGEAVSDYLVFHTNAYAAVILGFVFLCLAFFIQFRVTRYIAWVYWFAAGMVAVFGTMAADVIHVVLGIPYIISSISFFILLVCLFIIWQKVEHTVSIHSITTTRREIFYWACVIATFALGTALGDLTAATFSLGYFGSIIAFVLLMCIPIYLYFVYKTHEIAMFWIAYILTRPLGASIADYIGKTKPEGGLGIGTGMLSIVLLICIIASLVYITVSKKERNAES